ncbi:hypothetical protein Vadar_009984 [Vaccinium darrowii]|uniref:Uncharacterized protein n=3 Tax=Vaccinium darrowii TaxID=229202 RepID=A0ACB7YVB8_9ERIC|nr:hypothetical protein Vadar_003627 [Vaccinium darrowii]KAH7851490.1 hypothetical protein Vadar_012440 [Vaccinium darrowii]KAH7857189.1 hypothetical protein Vadar_009984 [Vaccinium darrowii]
MRSEIGSHWSYSIHRSWQLIVRARNLRLPSSFLPRRSKLLKLTSAMSDDTEYKLETFSGVYRKLSGKDVIFEYPITEA